MPQVFRSTDRATGETKSFCPCQDALATLLVVGAIFIAVKPKNTEVTFMTHGRIIIITGSPGTGKTMTASIVAGESELEKSVHIHTDDFYHYLSSERHCCLNMVCMNAITTPDCAEKPYIPLDF